jgi:hypothetical protein
MTNLLYRNDEDCSTEICDRCHNLTEIPTGNPWECSCGCRWMDEPRGAGRDPYGRPSPRTHPEYWTE